ncbi:MAG: AAA family ATPase [Candidatus Omnitrophica bacterium]|nr:AAA family ATPase [Candidatus Omnitrophota bacterium]
MKMLLAGPGTGKTTRVKSIIRNDYPNAENVLVLSFTNATINDLKESFKDFDNVSCYTLHSYALKINHLPNLHVLQDPDEQANNFILNLLAIF